MQCGAGHDDGSIRVWNLESSTCTDLHHHTNTVTCLAMAQVSEVDEVLFSAGVALLHHACSVMLCHALSCCVML